MLRKNILMLSLVSILLGCGEGREESFAVIGQGGGATQAVETALYFPGGVGIDFGRKPFKDVVVQHKVGEELRSTRYVTYEFDTDYSAIDKDLTQVLKSEGYVKTELPPAAGRIVDIRYSKGSRNVMAYYQEVVSEGFNKKTVLVLYWRQ